MDGYCIYFVGLLNQVYHTNDLMNWADWLIFSCWQWWNNFWFDGQSTLYLWHLNAGGPLQLYLAEFFRRNSLRVKTKKYAQKWPQNRVFPLFWKSSSLIFAGNILLNKTWYWFLFYCTNLISGEIVLEF